MKAAVKWTLSLGVLVAVAFALRGRFEGVAGAGVPWPHPLSLVAALVAFVVANELLVRAWLGLVALGGGHLPRPLGRWVWARTQLARYVIGMAQVASRAMVARQHGLSATTGAVTTLLEVLWYASINGVLVLATLPWWLPDTGLAWAGWLAVLPGIVVVLAVAAPKVFVGLAGLAGRLPLFRRLPALARAGDLAVTRRQTAVLTLIYTANAIVRLAGFVALYVGVGGELQDVLRVTGAFALGHLVGAVAVFAPGGLGPREGVTAVALAPAIGTGPVLMLVAATRLLELLAEVGYAAAARYRDQRDGSRPDPHREGP